MSADDDGLEVVDAVAGRGVLRVLTRWAVAYGGPCEHEDASQLARPTSIRSSCMACAARDPHGWALTGPCDACSRYVDEPGRWWVPDPDRTGGIAVLCRLCSDCSRRELHDPESPEEDTMICEFCKFGLQGGHRLSRLHRGWFHADCLRAAAGQGALVASAGDPGVARSMRIAAARVRILGRER